MTVVLLALLLWQSPAEPLSEQALAAAQGGDTETAARLWRQAIERDPKHFASLFNLGVLLHRQKRQQEAAPSESAAAMRPGYQCS